MLRLLRRLFCFILSVRVLILKVHSSYVSVVLLYCINLLKTGTLKCIELTKGELKK